MGGNVPYRIIFMGTPAFGVPILQALIDGPDQVVAVVCQPDRPAGRGRKKNSPPVKDLALQHEIEVLQPTAIKTDEFAVTLAAYKPDLIAVAAYGRILPPHILNLPPLGCINVHGSLLPRHRGAAPIQWAIIEGDPEVGITIMQMDEGMDTGDMLAQTALTPAPDETSGSLLAKLAQLGATTLLEVIDALHSGGVSPTGQNHAGATNAPPLKKEDGYIDWNRPAIDLEHLIRGLDPWPVARCLIHEREVQLFKPVVVYRDSSQPPGTILSADRQGLLIATGRKCLLIGELKPAGKKRMTAGELLNGWPLKPGDICRQPVTEK